MKYFLLRDEKNISEISEKLFKGLTPHGREQAEAALLKENPELKKITRARKGYLVRIPKTLQGGKADRRKVVDPFDRVANEMLDGLETLETRLSQTFAAHKEHQKSWTRTLTAAGKSLKQHPNASERSKALKKHLSDTRAGNDKKAKQIAKALAQLQKTVADFDR